MLTGFADYTKFLTLRDEPSWWNNIYFISFFFITNIIFLNILTGLICDSTDAMMSNEEQKEENENISDNVAGSDGNEGSEGNDGDEYKKDNGSNIEG